MVSEWRNNISFNCSLQSERALVRRANRNENSVRGNRAKSEVLYYTTVALSIPRPARGFLHANACVVSFFHLFPVFSFHIRAHRRHWSKKKTHRYVYPRAMASFAFRKNIYHIYSRLYPARRSLKLTFPSIPRKCNSVSRR